MGNNIYIYAVIIFIVFILMILMIPEIPSIDQTNKQTTLQTVSSVRRNNLREFEYNNRLNQIQYLNQSNVFNNYTMSVSRNTPILIPSECVKIIRKKNKPISNFIRNDMLDDVGYLSPVIASPISSDRRVSFSPEIIPYQFNENGRKFGSISEKLTCKIFEEYLCREVNVGIRPNFMKNPETNRNLELDMYDPVLKIAIEYNGMQHYEYTPKFHNTVVDFNKQVQRDELKKKLCEENGITLIIIPYTIDSAILNSEGKYIYKNMKPEHKEQKLKEHLIPILDILVP